MPLFFIFHLIFWCNILGKFCLSSCIIPSYLEPNVVHRTTLFMYELYSFEDFIGCFFVTDLFSDVKTNFLINFRREISFNKLHSSVLNCIVLFKYWKYWSIRRQFLMRYDPHGLRNISWFRRVFRKNCHCKSITG